MAYVPCELPSQSLANKAANLKGSTAFKAQSFHIRTYNILEPEILGNHNMNFN